MWLLQQGVQPDHNVPTTQGEAQEEGTCAGFDIYLDLPII